MSGNVERLMNEAAKKRLAGATPEQKEARRLNDLRAERLQSGPIKRGPNAPKDGTFGGKPANG